MRASGKQRRYADEKTNATLASQFRMMLSHVLPFPLTIKFRFPQYTVSFFWVTTTREKGQ